ncbi:hypothetical protein RB25_25260 [Herbaspirillum rubrisubalbicans]|uniref:Uncharacterized protein n=1 Tax=Herbaspirillum rubrisubalbicans Os34 TaxID=1235827 RepID=A0A6M3ZV35_9BURK|nr:hypothetical protein [Herbaspirillum rubrisubalbicans]QJQ02438.1 hypothetical protein C798_20030 [Herbaspirillum rubrisubalbicans Os34]RAN42707.1 hypothetical protein RB25_25260 [Herbaspirillum rubrisubalbicans]
MMISEILADKDVVIGTEITFQGIFVLERDTGYFVQSKENFRNKSCAIMVDFLGLKELLFLAVPPYGGSVYSYFNDAVIAGTLIQSGNIDFPLALNNIVELTLYVSEEEFRVIPST